MDSYLSEVEVNMHYLFEETKSLAKIQELLEEVLECVKLIRISTDTNSILEKKAIREFRLILRDNAEDMMYS